MRNGKRLAFLLTLVMILSMLVTPAFAGPVNLITNGNFEAGNTGFSTEYNYVAATGSDALQPPFAYAIGENPSQYHSAWTPGFTDHTSGFGKMMIVNGTSVEAGEPNKLVWEQNVTLPACEPNSYPLFAGQYIRVGDVLVKSDGSKICVKFVLNADAIAAGWLISEVHVAVADDASGIPNKNGNPIPGKFPINETIDPGVTETDWFCLEAIGTAPYAIAAHAVVKKTDCIVNKAAPYGPDEVVDTIQGLRYDNTPVNTIRSTPGAALVFEGTKLETDFYSLGFGPGDEEDDAYLTVRFDTPILNGPGNDLQIIEDTWGLPYPVESCAVYASANGIDWEYLGEADNQTPLADGVHTFTNFDLGQLTSASYVKVQDTSIRSDFADLYPSQGATLDGFDVNAILSLQTNKTCTTYSETAWGGENDFPGKNWAKYINYTPNDCSDSYLLEFWAASSYPAAPAQLQVTINDAVVGDTLDLTETVGKWEKYSAVWNANGATFARIKIRDLRYTFTGDDFCIDDISFIKQP